MHAHGHEHARLRADRRALSVALGLIACFLVVEVVVGLLADSLAVLADAGHMLSDAASLALALFAAWLAGRPATPQRSFGYRRAEILAALANGVAAGRRRDLDLRGGGAALVRSSRRRRRLGARGRGDRARREPCRCRCAPPRGSDSLNVRGALLHVLADLLGRSA